MNPIFKIVPRDIYNIFLAVWFVLYIVTFNEKSSFAGFEPRSTNE